MKTYTIQELREKNKEYGNSVSVADFILWLSYVEKQVEKPVPKIEEIEDGYSHDTNLDELSRKINEIIRYINNNK